MKCGITLRYAKNFNLSVPLVTSHPVTDLDSLDGNFVILQASFIIYTRIITSGIIVRHSSHLFRPTKPPFLCMGLYIYAIHLA